MPRATARREDGTSVWFGGDGADAGDPLGMQVIYNCPQVGPPPGLFKHTISQIEKAPRGEDHCGAFGGVTPAGMLNS